MHPFDEEWNTGIQPKLSYFHLRSLYHFSVIFLQQANCPWLYKHRKGLYTETNHETVYRLCYSLVMS